MRRLSAKHYAQTLWQAWQKTPAAQHEALLQAFLELLRDQRALKYASRILNQVQVLEDAANGVRRARVEAATALDPQQLAAGLKAALGPVDVDFTVNPKLIGGLRVQIGDELIDASIATQLQNLQHHLSTVS
jgi:F-type H+-transporting ATPase subunit delta